MPFSGSPRCINPACDPRGRLEEEPGSPGHLVCRTCGATLTVRSYGRHYGKATGQWVVFGAVMGAVGYPLEEAWQQGAVGVAVCVGLVVMARVIRQIRWLKGAA